VITVDILPGSTEVKVPRSRNEFCGKGNPSKEAVRNWERVLRRYLADYREESPSANHDLTPYQQWVLLVIHQEFRGWKNNHTRLDEIRAWIKRNKEQIRKEKYENQSVDREIS
jgi:hypothetical protein